MERQTDIVSTNSYKDKLCFVLCSDHAFLVGARGAIRSIRKQYAADEVDIVIFVDRPDANFERFCRRMSVDLQYFSSIAEWVLPLVYGDEKRTSDTRHFYHTDFEPVPALPHHKDRSAVGFDRIRHLHPLNVKAYCTGYAICHLRYARVVHIDTDAFLLGPVDSIFDEHSAPDTVIGFDDGDDDLCCLELLYDVARPVDFDSTRYSFNAGLVFYNNGPNVERMIGDFMFYIESCYHYTMSGWGGDQRILRTLVGKYHITGTINYALLG